MGCGAQLRVDFVDMFYDHETGDQRFNLVWICPKWNWYGGFWSHTRYKSDDNGDTYAFQS